MSQDYAFGLLPYKAALQSCPAGANSSQERQAACDEEAQSPPCVIVPDSEFITVRGFAAALAGCSGAYSPA